MIKFEDILEANLVVEEITGQRNETIEDLVDGLVFIGRDDKVRAFHDDFLGLKDNLSKELLRTQIDELDEDTYENMYEKHEEEIKDILFNAETIIFHFQKELTEEDEEDIREDRYRRTGRFEEEDW